MNDWKLALRQLLKKPGFTAVAVLTLAVGMALVACAFATVNAYLIQSLPYPTARNIYHVRYAPPGPYEPRGMSAIDWNTLSDVVEDTINSAGGTLYFMEGGSVRTTRTLQVSSGFFRGLGVQPTFGRAFVEDEYAAGSELVAVIGHDVWRNRFGSDPQIIGRKFDALLDETGRSNATMRVVGVLPAGFWFGRDSSAKVDILTPLRSRPRTSQTYLIRLREGIPVSFAEQRITQAARAVGSDFRPGWSGVHLQSMHDRYVEGIRPILVGVTIATGIVLFLACANVAVLVLLRALRRQKEMAVRIALGASAKHIVRMLLAEACFICIAALLAGLFLTQSGLSVLTPVIEQQLGKPSPATPSQIHVDSTVLLAIGTVSVVIALSLAFIPLLAPLQRRLADALRAQGTSSTEGPFMRRFRASLIGFEIAGSLILLAGCGLMIRSVINLTSADLGFNPEHVVRIGVRLPARTYAEPAALDRFFRAMDAKLPDTSNSKRALMSAFPSFYPANTHRFEVDSATSEQNPAGLMRVGAGYFDLYKVPIMRGREFAVTDRIESEQVALVSETLAQRLWPNTNPIGQRIRVAEGDMPETPFASWRTVVGVVGDIRQGYDDSDLRDIYIPFLQAPTRFSSIHVRTDQPTKYWEGLIQQAAAEIDPFAQVGAATTIESEDRRGVRSRFLASMLTGFAAFAALLAVIGIYGVTRYAAQQREREIAIRVAIGATKDAITGMFLKDSARVVCGGLCVGLLGTLGVARLLQSVVYGVKPFDLVTIISVCFLMIVTALVAVWLPARRAAERDPMSVLKEG